LTDAVLSSIVENTTTREIWNTLTSLYEVKSLYTRIFLKRKLYTLQMSESTSVTDHINNLNTLFAQLSAVDFNIIENELQNFYYRVYLIHMISSSSTLQTTTLLTSYTLRMFSELFLKKNPGERTKRI